MIEFKSLTIQRNIPDALEIIWEVKPTAENLGDYQVKLYASHAPSLSQDDYTLVASGLALNSFSYLDYSMSGLSHGTRSWYYRIEAIHVPSSASIIFPATYSFLNDDNQNYVWSRIWRDKNLGLQKKIGRDFLLLKKRTWGTRCETAWDPILFHQTTKKCNDCNCWGTGWREGFFPPQKFRGMVNPAPKAKDLTIWGEFYPSDIILYALNRPPLEPGDIVVDLQTDKRYSVQRIRLIEVLGKIVEQQAQMSLLHVDDEIYSLDIKEYR